MDRASRWVAQRVKELGTPLLVCKPLLAQAMDLLARFSTGQERYSGFSKMVRSGSRSALKS
jgi:hypothetical protein